MAADCLNFPWCGAKPANEKILNFLDGAVGKKYPWLQISEIKFQKIEERQFQRNYKIRFLHNI